MGESPSPSDCVGVSRQGIYVMLVVRIAYGKRPWVKTLRRTIAYFVNCLPDCLTD
ncbi:MAG: hypothetical protein LBU34_01955 [Planctomycetaceae bacterium]|nr:hypothetical protein [Planctomycetaceae bacterium]